ncbi:MAG: glutamyl-tRNA reductase [Methanomassiliicoccaceae archaeon]|nr:glutamyl-tRNA reductase [Methanomassiliicoccaceae archaeon]
MIISLHVTHSDAGVEAMSEVRNFMESNLHKYLENTLTQNEHVILSTCNRFEIYVGTDDADPVRKEFETFIKNMVPRSKERAVPFILQGKETVKHLFRVTCGLDSLMVGETQIQGQVRETYVRAKEAGHVSKYLSKLFERALSVGKRARFETRVNTGNVSVGSAAVELAERRFGGLKDRTVTIVGAGSVAADITKGLKNKGPNAVFVSNRTIDRASELALEVNGTALSMDYLVSAIAMSDVVFVATSAPHMIITKDTIMSAGPRKHPLMIIDVSVPKNVDYSVREINDISLENMDDFSEVAADNMRKRSSEIIEAERIVNDELARVDAEHMEARADKIIGGIGRKAVSIREEEVTRAKERAASADVNDVLDDMSRVILSRMLANTYETLRKASLNGEVHVLDIAKDLFGLEVK